MALTRKYDNGPNGWTDYDSNGNAVAAGTSGGYATGYSDKDYAKPSANYVTNNKGQTTSQYNQGNSQYNVAPGSVFDPLSSNYNWLVANSGGKISLSDLDSSTGTGLSSNYNGTAGSGSPIYQGGYSQPPSQKSYQDALVEYNNMIATQAANAKKEALRQAWESNSQALNSQKSTVDNNYNSAANKLNAVRDARLPEFQQQRDSVSADASQNAMRLKEIMAATGRGDSGYSRSNQMAVDLNRSNALSSLTGSENQFKTDVSNQLSDVDAQRVAALNDIAGKLQLGEKQLNDGTLSLTNQLESEKASGALKAFLEAQTRADQLAQQSLDNSFRQSQANQAASLAALQQQWQEKQYAADQEAQAFNQALQAGQITGTYNGQSTLAKQAQEAEQAYRQAALAVSSAKAYAPKANTPKYSDSSTASMKDKMDNALSNGASAQELLYELDGMEKDGTTDLKNVDVAYLRSYLQGKVPTISDLRRSQGGGI